MTNEGERSMEPGSQQQEVYDYFSQEGFARLFAAAKRKYESLGRVGGKLRLAHLRADERQQLSGLLSRSLRRQNTVTVRMQELEAILLASRFEIDLHALLRLLYGAEIKSKAVQQDEVNKAWRVFVEKWRDSAVAIETRHWLEGMYETEAYGYRTFQELFEEVQQAGGRHNDLEAGIRAVIKAMDHLPVREGKKQPLAVFAAVECGDPHFFDRNQRWGRLLYYGILDYLAYHGISSHHLSSPSDSDEDGKNVNEAEEKATSSFIRYQYEQAGLRLDSLSSQVLVIDIDIRRQVGAYWLTLDTVERLQQHWRQSSREQAAADSSRSAMDAIFAFVHRVLAAGKIFVNENPPACEALVGFLARQEKEYGDLHRQLAPFLCTSGQPSVAALALLDFFAAYGVDIYYSGDLDVVGLEMALALQRRYPSLWHPWGMTSAIVHDTYKTNPSSQTAVSFTDEECRRLHTLTCAWDRSLPAALVDGGKKIYEEMLLPVLFEEYKKVNQLNESKEVDSPSI